MPHWRYRALIVVKKIGLANFPNYVCRVPSFYLGTTIAGVEFWRGVNPLRDRLKLDNCVTRAMWVVMKLVRVAGIRHLRNWEAPDALE